MSNRLHKPLGLFTVEFLREWYSRSPIYSQSCDGINTRSALAGAACEGRKEL